MLFKGDAIDAFYNDVEDKEEALYWARRLQHGCLGQFSEKVDVEPWSFYPAIYVLTEYDNAGTREKQEELIEMMGDGCRKVIRMNTGHSPFLSKPKEMADVVKEAVKDGEEWSGVASAL